MAWNYFWLSFPDKDLIFRFLETTFADLECSVIRLSQAFVLARLYAKCPAQVYENGDNVLLWQTYLQTVWTAARSEFVMKISWCDHSNEISSAALLYNTTVDLSLVESYICGHFWKEMVTGAFSILQR